MKVESGGGISNDGGKSPQERLFARYRRDLLQSSNNDEPLDASLATQYRLKDFLRLLKGYQGDTSLALAAYNAGLNGSGSSRVFRPVERPSISGIESWNSIGNTSRR
jgi:hypothetical protein